MKGKFHNQWHPNALSMRKGLGTGLATVANVPSRMKAVEKIRSPQKKSWAIQNHLFIFKPSFCIAVRLGGMCNKNEDCLNTSSNRRTECWHGVCSCGAGFKPTPNKKDCVEACKFRKHVKSCKNIPTINQILSVFSLHFSCPLQSLLSQFQIPVLWEQKCIGI